MNREQKEVLQAQLNREKQTIAELKQVYAQAAKDVENRIRELSMRTDMENLQTIIYQKQYQEVLKKQIDNVLDSLHTQEFATIESFLTNCYTDGYIGVMYDIAGQGIPIIMPIDPKQVVKALQTDSKISTKLYTRLGEDVKKLKASIRAELSRGITQGASYNQIAVKIAKGMKSDYNTAYNSAVRIARTEGHRIQCQSAYDAQKAAVSKGADVVKQWNSVLDGRTRPHHRQLDGQIRELNEPFEIGTLTADYPGAFGRASEDCNCRCALLQRARWALDEEELETLKKRAEYFDLDKSKDFEDYQKKYLKASEQVRDSGQKKNDEDTSQEQATDKKKSTNKNGEEIQFEFSQMNEERQKMVRETIEELASNYNTNLIKVVDGAAHYGKNRSNMGIDGIMALSRGETKEVVIHEFGHSLAIQKAEKMGIQNNSAFWKELRKIHKEYKDEVFRYGQKQYALDGTGYAESIDEFLAEGFAAAILNDKNVNEKYPQKVIAIVDKYFKKETLENTGKNGIIKVGNQALAESKHASKRVVQRQVTDAEIQDAIKNPLHKGDEVIDELGRKSIKYIGKNATVCVNPDTGVITTLWKTGTRTRKKYEEGD